MGEGKYSNMMKLILLSALAAVALAEPEPHYGYYGHPYYHQLGWPSVRAPGFSSTCWGCRGKRSAEPSPHGFYGYYGHPFVYHGLAVPAVADNTNRVNGVAAAVRSSFDSAWPGATVSVNNGKKKRSAEPHGYYGYYGHPYGYYGYPYLHHVAAQPAEVADAAYTAAWPGADVSVDHAGKKKRSA